MHTHHCGSLLRTNTQCASRAAGFWGSELKPITSAVTWHQWSDRAGCVLSETLTALPKLMPLLSFLLYADDKYTTLPDCSQRPHREVCKYVTCLIKLIRVDPVAWRDLLHVIFNDTVQNKYPDPVFTDQLVLFWDNWNTMVNPLQTHIDTHSNTIHNATEHSGGIQRTTWSIYNTMSD